MGWTVAAPKSCCSVADCCPFLDAAAALLAGPHTQLLPPLRGAAYDKRKYMWKLLYTRLLGYDVDFGVKNASDLIAAPGFALAPLVCLLGADRQPGSWICSDVGC